ncbi:MAG: [FeFe] hydrogenase H-cluster radical SAM maturase HydE [Bacteroidetes bacterium CG18_big_fil_WC_8_21_14_2_50_41_14]|nr:MAG: [FeFe] hydrogenase H-cluster radical SAM maturase HydE [Bacteroidetes bacterium CG18_big_fil_WC_8_21_14_2_50_41_14]
MSRAVASILKQRDFNRETLVRLLEANEEETRLIFSEAARIKHQKVGNRVYLRGLIELSNICAKDCLYCGIRKSNENCQRYVVSDAEIDKAIQYAVDSRMGSLVIQSGELQTENFIERVNNILIRAREIGKGELGVTLSCGEQSRETYEKWRELGASRYLLRIESSNQELYYKIHPQDETHRYQVRLNALRLLKSCGYQVGTGVMIGLPFQTMDDLAADLLFMRDLDIDMCGMGPYIEHQDTPLYQYKNQLHPVAERVQLSLKMIALLRILMQDINIASTTALQALDKQGRIYALKVGANVMMPNITPGLYRNNYALYLNKPGMDEEAEDSLRNLEKQVHDAGCVVGYGVRGDSVHYSARKR